jgi:hypothetical protein
MKNDTGSLYCWPLTNPTVFPFKLTNQIRYVWMDICCITKEGNVECNDLEHKEHKEYKETSTKRKIVGDPLTRCLRVQVSSTYHL